MKELVNIYKVIKDFGVGYIEDIDEAVDIISKDCELEIYKYQPQNSSEYIYMVEDDEDEMRKVANALFLYT